MEGWSIIVSVCHLVMVGNIETPACHEEIAIRHRTRVEACQLAQFGIAQWQPLSPFADYTIGGWRCDKDSQATVRDKT
jgi:hypothetical protein